MLLGVVDVVGPECFECELEGGGVVAGNGDCGSASARFGHGVQAHWFALFCCKALSWQVRLQNRFLDRWVLT